MPKQEFAEGLKGGTPPGKEGEEIDLRIAHWCLFGPNASGMYETTRELIMYENRIPGVLAGFCQTVDADKASTNKIREAMQGGKVDPRFPEFRSQDWGWALKWADIHVIHTTFPVEVGKIHPKAFFCHGTAEAMLLNDLQGNLRSFSSSMDWIDRMEATFVTNRRAQLFLSPFDPTGGKKIHLIPKGIDLEWWQRSTTKQNLEGNPSVLYGEIWRDIKHPFYLFYAVNELYKENKNIRLNMWGCEPSQRKFWDDFIRRSDFDSFMGHQGISNLITYPEQYYSRGDILVSPVFWGDLSRVHQESLACGCPVITWDSDPWKDNHAYKYANAFDVYDLALKINETYGELLDDKENVSKKCRQIAEEHFDMTKEAKMVVDVLRKVVAESK